MTRHKRWLAIAIVPVAALTIGACNSGGQDSQSYKDGWNYAVQDLNTAGITDRGGHASDYTAECQATGEADAVVTTGDDLGQWAQGCADAYATNNPQYVGPNN